MAKNILVITGSPRKHGNSDLLAEAFMKGARAAGHEVVSFSSAANRVEGCIACDTCWKKGKACSFDDGFDILSPLLEQADVLVLCSPLYWFTFSTQLKAALDKMYAYTVPQGKSKLKIQESVLMMCAAETEESVFSGAVGTYKEIARFLELKDRGVLLVPSVLGKGDIKRTDALERAEKMGREI